MLLLSRTAYLRWVAACLVVVAAIGWEVTKRAEEPFPFARRDIPAGAALSDEDIEWRSMPSGFARVPDLAAVVASVPIGSGDPITISVAGPPPLIPDGWWSVPVEIPIGAPHGTRVRLSLPDGRTTNGVVDVPSSADSFGLTTPGSVAVPEMIADAVAVASAEGVLVVMLPPTGHRTTNEIAPNATQ